MRSKFLSSVTLIAMGATAVSGTVWAHDGHGLSGAHWHATDAWGFAVVACFSALALWLGTREK